MIGAGCNACFNPRPREGGDAPASTTGAGTTGFNPRPREGGDTPTPAGGTGMTVSIHAPAKGATYALPRPRRGLGVSIHAPAKGATYAHGVTYTKAAAFQSTPPRRGRPAPQAVQRQRLQVSIHAPAKGATAAIGANAELHLFQSTPPRRGRHARERQLGATLEFQSTPPRRGRPQPPALAVHRIGVSIHAPAKGATTCRWPRGPCACFNPRPREGGDSSGRGPGTRRVGFQSTPPRRGRLVSIASPLKPPMFQSTPPRRGRPVRAAARSAG